MPIVSVPLTQGKFAVIDEEDWPLVSQHKWRLIRSQNGLLLYALTRVKDDDGKVHGLQMHRLITNAPKELMIDHRDGDGLNNQRLNLRFATASTNQAAKHRWNPGVYSRFRGVTWNRSCRKWQASVKVDGRSKYLGVFAEEEVAARAYDEAARKYFGDFAMPNFPESDAA